MKKTAVLLSLLVCLGLITACGSQPAQTQSQPAGETQISLEGGEARIEGGGADYASGILCISSGGSYRIQGELEGRILVDTGAEKENVELILDGADIRSSKGPAIYVENARDTTISVPEGKESIVVSGAVQQDLQPAEYEAKGAAIQAEDDLVLTGPGCLRVEGYINNAVSTKNDLLISGAVLKIRAVNNGLRGSQSVQMNGGDVEIECLNDAVKTTAKDKEDEGSVIITAGSLRVLRAGDRGISAVRDIVISGGELDMLCLSDGLHAGDDQGPGKLLLTGGSLKIRSGSDAMELLGGAEIRGGSLLALGDDKDIKSSLSGSQICYAGGIALDEGESLLLADSQGTELMRLDNCLKADSVYISLPQFKTGESYQLLSSSGDVIAVIEL